MVSVALARWLSNFAVSHCLARDGSRFPRLLYLGRLWHGKQITIQSDNHAVYNAWSTLTSSHQALMDLIRRIYFCGARWNFLVRIRHIPGVKNDISDALSRFQESRFRRLVTGAQPTGQALPEELSEVPTALLQRQFGLSALDEPVSQLVSSHLAPATRRVYGTGTRRFLIFCLTHGCPYLSFDALSVRRFAAYLQSGGVSPKTGTFIFLLYASSTFPVIILTL